MPTKTRGRSATRTGGKRGTSSTSKKGGKSSGKNDGQSDQLISYDYCEFGAGFSSFGAVALMATAAFTGNEWWHIKREYTEIWVGLRQTCYNWRGSYECQDNIYQDFEKGDCSVAGSAVETRFNAVFYCSLFVVIVSAAAGAVCMATAVKFRRKKGPIRAASFLAFASLLLACGAVGVFYQTQSGFAFCDDYCSHLEGTCTSEHGITMRYGIAAASLNFVALLLSLFKNFDRRLDDDVMVGDSGDELDEEDFTDLRGRGRKALPGARGARGSNYYEEEEFDDETSDVGTIPAQRGRGGAQRTNPIKKALPPAAEEEYQYGDYCEEEEGEYPEAYAQEEEEAAPADDGDLCWDDETGMYWSNEKQLHYDQESGHYYDSASGQWFDPVSDCWYEV